jgi:predicted helicase
MNYKRSLVLCSTILMSPFSVERSWHHDMDLGMLWYSHCVESKMRLSKDKTTLAVNDSLTLAGIPPETFTYRLGNRSALDWIIDQYQVYTDPRTHITSDPNAWGEEHNNPEYIIQLVAKIITVSLETMKIVNTLPAHFAEN